MTHYRSDDPSVRNAIAETGNPDLFPALDIPRTTAESWIRKAFRIQYKRLPTADSKMLIIDAN